MSTKFSQDLCGNNVDKTQSGFMRKNCRQNSVRVYAEIMLTNSVMIYAEIMTKNFSKDLCGNNVDKFSKDLCGNNVDKIQKGFMRKKNCRQNFAR